MEEQLKNNLFQTIFASIFILDNNIVNLMTPNSSRLNKDCCKIRYMLTYVTLCLWPSCSHDNDFSYLKKFYHYYSPAKWIFAGSFELAILRMSRYYELNQNCVLYADTLLPQEAFYTTDPNEQKLVALAFEVARGVAELKLTETELALYSACVLLSPGNGFGMKRILRVLTVIRSP